MNPTPQSTDENVLTVSNFLEALNRVAKTELALETRVEHVYRDLADVPMPKEVVEAARAFDAAGTETLLIESKIDDGRTLTICLAPGAHISARIE